MILSQRGDTLDTFISKEASIFSIFINSNSCLTTYAHSWTMLHSLFICLFIISLMVLYLFIDTSLIVISFIHSLTIINLINESRVRTWSLYISNICLQDHFQHRYLTNYVLCWTSKFQTHIIHHPKHIHYQLSSLVQVWLSFSSFIYQVNH